jgi:hypothetical protein
MRIGTLIALALVAAAIVLAISGRVDFDRTRRSACHAEGPFPGSPRGQIRFDHLVCR